MQIHNRYKIQLKVVASDLTTSENASLCKEFSTSSVGNKGLQKLRNKMGGKYYTKSTNLWLNASLILRLCGGGVWGGGLSETNYN